jgi:endonuclease/exonuclease/phosphatase family metal-dependent hydrolase
MVLKVGTFNFNNLFDRFNYEVELEKLPARDRAIKTQVEIVPSPPGEHPGRARRFKGRLIKAKPEEERRRLAERIRDIDLDVLCAQEVEDIEALREFATGKVKDGGLRTRYPHLALIEGNDPRFIDVAVLSKRPLGAVTSWQHTRHPDKPDERVFSRDLLEVDVLTEDFDRVVLTIFNTHLKSQFIPHDAKDRQAEQRANDRRRRRQAEMAAAIIDKRTSRRTPFLLLGDLNDAPDAPTLAPLTESSKLELADGLEHVNETRPFADEPAPPGPRWTHRFRDSDAGTTEHELFDQIWLGPALKPKLREAWIDRRRRKTKDGSDHDPAWVVLDGIP